MLDEHEIAEMQERVDKATPIVFFNTQMSNGNAEFLSNAKSDVMDLLADNAELRKEVQRLTHIITSYQNVIMPEARNQLSAMTKRYEAVLTAIETFTKDEMNKHTLEESLILQPILNRIYRIRKRGTKEDV